MLLMSTRVTVIVRVGKSGPSCAPEEDQEAPMMFHFTGLKRPIYMHVVHSGYIELSTKNCISQYELSI